MKKGILLNSEIVYEIGKIGHTQSLCIADSGLPIPKNIKRIDVSICRGIPSFLDVLEAILSEMQVERALLAKELKSNPSYLNSIIEKLKHYNPKINIDYCPHTTFKGETEMANAIIKSGEQTPYANILLYSGVVF